MRSTIAFNVKRSLRLLFYADIQSILNVLQHMILPYNCINTVLVIASTENGLVYREWYFQNITLTERNNY